MEEKEIAVEVVNDESTYSDDEIDIKVNELITLIKRNNYEYSDEIYQLAKVIANNSKEYLDDKTYYWVLYAYNLKYIHDKNDNARLFIMLRIRNLITMKQVREDKRAKALTYTNFEMDQHINDEASNECAFVKERLKKNRLKFAGAQIALGLIFVGLISFIFKIIALPVAIGIAVLITLLNCFISFKTLDKTYLYEQTQRSKSYCKDQEIIDFDLPVMNS